MAHECLDAWTLATRLGGMAGDPFIGQVDCDEIEVLWLGDGRPRLRLGTALGDPFWPLTSRDSSCASCAPSYETLRWWHRAVDHPHPWVWRELETSRKLEATFRHLSAQERQAALAADPRLPGWGYCQRLLFQVQEGCFQDPQISLQAAELAVAISETLESTWYGAGHSGRLQAKAWSWLGNARRVASKILAAEAAFERAGQIAAGHPGLPKRAQAETFSLKASLSIDQRRFEEAGELLAQAATLFEEEGLLHRAAQVKVKWSKALYETGRQSDSLKVLEAGLRDLDSQLDPRGAHGGHTNLALLLIESGLPERALGVLDSAPPTQDPALQLYAQWAQARALAAIERDREAEDLFLEVRASNLRLGKPYDAALVSLDLAGLYVRQQRHLEAVCLTREAYPFFQKEGIQREAIASLLLLEKLVEDAQLS